jgi:hypothetical protein
MTCATADPDRVAAATNVPTLPAKNQARTYDISLPLNLNLIVSVRLADELRACFYSIFL